MTHTRIQAGVIAGVGALCAPLLAFAQAPAQGQPIDKLGLFLQQFIGFIDNYLVPLLFAIAFIVFIFGIFRYFILGGADEEKRSQGRTLMLWGMIGFFVMVSIWGILNLFVHSLGFGSDSRPDLPTFGSPSSVSSQKTGGALPTAGPATSGGNTPSPTPTQTVNKCADIACPIEAPCNPGTGICTPAANRTGPAF